MEEPEKKKHRAPQSGAKAMKKLKGQSKAQNPKGFSVQHTTKAARMVRKTLDKESKKYRMPNVNATATVTYPPPLIVGIVGPPNSGKTTLIRALINQFTNEYIINITGPVTVVIGRKYRMTLIECDCNINSMIDIAKIADLILLTVNMRNGLEMYHFEFINMLQVHGMPRIIPVLNHNDLFKESSAAQAARKRIKQRLWNDLSAKIFVLSRFMKKKSFMVKKDNDGHEIDGEYMPVEVKRLSRLMIVKEPRPSDWRASHSYMLVDRLEDITNPRILNEDPKANRTVSLYGYIRGAPIEASFSNPRVHIPGLGDFPVAECNRQDDPCPTPEQYMNMHSSIEEAIVNKLKKRLSEGERKVYGPMSKIGGVLFDRDATYIDIGGSHHLGGGRLTSGRTKIIGAGEEDLKAAREMFAKEGFGLDERLEKDHRVQILADAPLLPSKGLATIEEEESDSDAGEEDGEYDVNDYEDVDDEDNEEDSEQDEVNGIRMFEDTALPKSFQESMDIDDDDDDYDEGSSEDSDLEELMAMKKKPTFDRRHQDLKNAFDNLEWQGTSSGRKNWKRIVYNSDEMEDAGNTETEPADLMGDMFRVTTTIDEKTTQADVDDVTLPRKSTLSINWNSATECLRQILSNRFSTGEYNATEDAKTLLEADSEAQRTLAALKAQKLAKAAGSHVQYKPQEKNGKDNDIDDSGGIDDDEENFEDNEDDVFDEEDMEMDDGDDENEGDEGDEEKDEDPTAGFEKSLLRPSKQERIAEKRRRHKELFEKIYEAAQRGTGDKEGESATAYFDKVLAKKQAQEELNREVLKQLPPGIREKVEGVSPGSYVRLKISDVPYQFVEHFNPRQPVIVGGIGKGEDAKSYIHARFQAHRWLKRPLKSNDPIIVSVGWRRYQTIAVFSKEEHNFRKRFLKYSLDHEHCHMTFYGPVVPARTGVIAFVNSTWRNQTESSVAQKFRVAGTGSVTDTNESFQIMKKLKLVGHPYKIFSKTAFIRGMFNSELEAAKMIGCKIQTVSKIRGIIKNVLTGNKYKPGDFRATFEATVRKADIVFLRSFVPIELNPFYNPIPNRILPQAGTAASEDTENKWLMIRTTGELRWDKGIKAEVKEDSKYKAPERVPFVPKPLTVPTKLVAALPFKDKPKATNKELRTQRFREDEVRRARTADIPGAVHPRGAIAENDIPDPVGHKRDRAQMLQRLREIHQAYLEKEHGKMVVRTMKYRQQKAEAARQAEFRNKQRRKQFFARRDALKKHSNK